jgi:hypothetical protein
MAGVGAEGDCAIGNGLTQVVALEVTLARPRVDPVDAVHPEFLKYSTPFLFLAAQGDTGWIRCWNPLAHSAGRSTCAW